ncbi:hypothetical protein [Tenacibaculum sp. 190524A02b]|uniref:hypothetical protein n=1 Tax=Tenacibaculum vairaonense TaxID=3137860 RepID=UPI0031FB0FFD
MKSKVVEAYKTESQEVYNKRFGVVFNGEDNLKPLIVENLIDSSPTALQCTWIYASFLGGGGFETDLSDINLSENFWETTTPNDLLFEVCDPISRHQGVFVHVGYNANYEKDSYKVVPYTLCRVGKKDSKGYSGKVVVSPKGWGRSVKKENIDVFDVYNPNPKVIQEQVDKVGGWDNYKGQIFYFKLSNKYTYSKSLIETAYTYADSEHLMGQYYNNTIKRRFEDVDVIRHRAFPDKSSEDAFYKNIKQVSGLENASSKLIVEDDWDDEREKNGNFRFDKLESGGSPDKYEHIETVATNKIRKVYKTPPQLIDFIQGKLGNTSGEDLKTAQAVYNSITARSRGRLEMFFKELFRNYKEPINTENNWTIKQYALLKDGTVDSKNITNDSTDE